MSRRSLMSGWCMSADQTANPIRHHWKCPEVLRPASVTPKGHELAECTCSCPCHKTK